MKISVNEAIPGQEARWINLNLDGHQDLADIWSAGVHVAAQHKNERAGNPSVLCAADAVMVRISLAYLPLATALEAYFTSQFASVAAYRSTSDGGELYLAFELPEAVTDARRVECLMSGLETIYSGSLPHKGALNGFGLAGSGESIVIGRKLNPQAMLYLERLGTEANELRRGAGAFFRSQVPIDSSTMMTLSDGTEARLDQLPHGKAIFCPVHVDKSPRAVVHWFQDGTPGVQCDCCKRTYSAQTTSRHYDFGHFDQVVRELAAQQTTYVKDGLELNAEDVTILHDRYLPPLELVEGVTFVKSPKGTNKTGALEQIVADCKKRHEHVLVIGHRRALLQSNAKRLKVDLLNSEQI